MSDRLPPSWKTFRLGETAVLLAYGVVVMALAFAIYWRGVIASIPELGRFVPAAEQMEEEDVIELSPHTQPSSEPQT